MGGTSLIIEALNFQPGDYMGKVTITWYMNMKDRKSM